MARLHLASFTNLRPWNAAEIAGMLESPLCFVVDEPLGFLMGRVVAGEAEVLTVAVDPAVRRQGVGTLLMARFLDAARTRKAEAAFLEVAADNLAALGLYHAFGFTQTGRRHDYYHLPDGTVVDAITMQRPL